MKFHRFLSVLGSLFLTVSAPCATAQLDLVPVLPSVGEVGLGYMGATVTFKRCKATIAISDNVKRYLSFKDADGNAIGPASCLQGPVTITLDIPNGTKAYDVSAQDPAGESVIEVPVGGEVGGRRAETFAVECLSVDHVTGDESFVYLARAVAADADTARETIDAVVLEGAGAEVPEGVAVDARVTLTDDGEWATIVSALPEEFGRFTIEWNGVPVADLADDLNVTTSTDGDWRIVRTVLPLTLLQLGSELVLVQQGAEEGLPVTYRMAIDPDAGGLPQG